MSRAAPTADLIETMRFDPHDGLIELDRHLDRLSASADDLGFKFDRHAARNELQAATFGRKRKAMARLLLSPTGMMAIEVKAVERARRGAGQRGGAAAAGRSGRLSPPLQDHRPGFFDEARRASGAYETVFTDPEGRLTEGSFTNIFVERDGKSGDAAA